MVTWLLGGLEMRFFFYSKFSVEVKEICSHSTKGGDSRAREEIHLAIYEFNVGS